MTGPNGRVTPRTMARLEQTERAVKLRREGHTYREIARELKVTLRQAHKLVTDAFKATRRQAKEATEELVQLQDERLEAMYRALAPKFESRGEGLARAVEVALKVLERQARLHGLDAPAKTETRVTYANLSDAELLEEAKRLRLDVHFHPPAPTLLLPGEASLPPALEPEVRALLAPTNGGSDGEATAEAGGAGGPRGLEGVEVPRDAQAAEAPDRAPGGEA